MTRPRLLLLCVVVLLIAFGIWWRGSGGEGDVGHADVTFVSPDACYGCHQEQHLGWQGSDHELAMQLATEDTVLADFDDTSFGHGGVEAHFSRKEGRFVARTDNAEGELADFDVEYVFGVRPLQQYLVKMDDGRVQCLLQAWDTNKKRWFFLYDEPIPHTDELHWTGPLQNWNFMCAECHSTNLQRNYDAETDTYDTTWSEINVGCQACHGPGSEHVKWAKANNGKDYAKDGSFGLVVKLSEADPKVEVEHCARCHARRSLVTGDYQHGDRFLDHYDLQLLQQPLYHVDGQIRDEVYVYGSFLQSKKHAQGVRCTDCHDPHNARLKRQGNDLCARCHQENPPEQFPTVKRKVYDTKDHHFHDPGMPGSFCVDCHMVDQVYMQVDPRRDHSFRVPRPDLTVKLGTPNACNDCHEDKDADWAAAEIESWYPDSGRRDKPHFGQVLAFANVRDVRVPEVLASLIADKDQPGIARATAVAHMGRQRGPTAQMVLQAALSDEEPLVRAAGVSAIVAQLPRKPAPGMAGQLAEALGPLLSDPIRLVRTEAAIAMARSVGQEVPAAYQDAMATARAEYVDRQQAHWDRAEGPFNMGVLHEAEGDAKAAEAAYAETLRRFADFIPARMNRAMLRNRNGRNNEALADLEVITKRHPEFGEGWYSKGLLLAEMEKDEAAAKALAVAVELMPERGRVRYNLGALLDKLKRWDEAEAAYLEANRWGPNNPALIQALVLLYVRQERWELAEQWGITLVQVAPAQPGPRELLKDIRARRKGR